LLLRNAAALVMQQMIDRLPAEPILAANPPHSAAAFSLAETDG